MAHTCIHGGYLPTIGNNYLTFMGTYVVYYFFFWTNFIHCRKELMDLIDAKNK